MHGCEYGGVNNTEIPNYVYRWTEREVLKTISAFAPQARHRLTFQYGHDLPQRAACESKKTVQCSLLSMAYPLYRVFAWLFPRQQNLLACMVEKPRLTDDLHPWVTSDPKEGLRLNRKWAAREYE